MAADITRDRIGFSRGRDRYGAQHLSQSQGITAENSSRRRKRPVAPARLRRRLGAIHRQRPGISCAPTPTRAPSSFLAARRFASCCATASCPTFTWKWKTCPAVTDLNEEPCPLRFPSRTSIWSRPPPSIRGQAAFRSRHFLFRARTGVASDVLRRRRAPISARAADGLQSRLSFAQQIGCQTIYLFGVDLGARDPKHHAKDAPYNAGELEFNTVIDEPVPGNLGGTVYSEWSICGRATKCRMSSSERAAPDLLQLQRWDSGSSARRPSCRAPFRRLPFPIKKIVGEVLARFDDYTPDMFAKSWVDRNVVLDVRAFQKKSWNAAFRSAVPAIKRRQSPRVELDYYASCRARAHPHHGHDARGSLLSRRDLHVHDRTSFSPDPSPRPGKRRGEAHRQGRVYQGHRRYRRPRYRVLS